MIWKSFFILKQIKLILTRKVSGTLPHFESEGFWNSEEAYSRMQNAHTVKKRNIKSRQHNHLEWGMQNSNTVIVQQVCAKCYKNCGVGNDIVYDIVNNMGYGPHSYLSHNSKYSRFNFLHQDSSMETRLPKTIFN